MDFLQKNAVALIALVVAILGCYLPVSAAVQNFGGVTNYDEVDAAGMRIGTGCNQSGSPSCVASRIGGVYAGTCILIAPNYTVAATTTVSMDCAVAGLVTGDIVESQFATSTTAGNGWVVTGASASSTSGFATLRVTNFTGASNVIPASIASTTQFEAYHLITQAPGL